MRISVLAAVASVLVLAGCNTYYQNSYEKVTVHTPGVDNAQCTLSTEKNKYRVLTPREVVVERSKLPMTVLCEKAGYVPASVVVPAKIYNRAGILNTFNGVFPGFTYDVASDSIYNYPDDITVVLKSGNVVPLEPLPQPEAAPLKEAPVQPAAPVEKETADKTMSKSLRK